MTVRAYYEALPSIVGWTRDRRMAGNRRDRDLRVPGQSPEVRSWVTNPAMERRKACAVRISPSQARRGQRDYSSVAPCGAPSPSSIEGETNRITRGGGPRERRRVAV